MSENTKCNSGVDDLCKLVASLHATKKRASELGLFTDDRELLECPQCGLKEDVTGYGVLFTYRGEPGNVDTGLRFQEPDAEGMTTCPDCGALVQGEWL